jgi:threonine dehydratase
MTINLISQDLKHHPISLAETYRARQIIKQYLRPTNLTRYEELSRAAGAQIYIKHENHNPIGCFKIRGGLTLIDHLRHDAEINGVITYSTGNHGLSIATAAQWLGLKAVIVVPVNANPVKKRAILNCGAELIESGKTFEDCARVVDKLSRERGLYFAHPCNEPLIINGVGTEFIEIVEDLPDVDVVIIPIGGGSEAAAAVTTLRVLKPSIQIIAVQAEASPAAYKSWKAGRITEARNKTFAGGVATGRAYEIPFSIYKDALTDFILLSEDEIYEGIALAGYYTHNLAEGAGAMPLAAALKIRDKLKGKRVVLQMSGCNASSQEVRTALERESFTSPIERI